MVSLGVAGPGLENPRAANGSMGFLREPGFGERMPGFGSDHDRTVSIPWAIE